MGAALLIDGDSVTLEGGVALGLQRHGEQPTGGLAEQWP